METCLWDLPASPLQELHLPLFEERGISLAIKRDDLLDPIISGNKWRKLKYNVLALKKSGQLGVVTFGGAYSNHLHALAGAGQKFGFPTVGIVRGEKPHIPSSTLQACANMGMQLHYVSREAYRLKATSAEVQAILQAHHNWMVLPEGGANTLAMQGCGELLREIDTPFDYLCTPCGTGATLAGLATALPDEAKLLGFPVLKGADASIWEQVRLAMGHLPANVLLESGYHFGGYAKYNQELLNFIQAFEKQSLLKIEQVYTGKMIFGLYDLAQKGYFKRGDRIVSLHTGGMQGRLPELDLY